jgi:hypothetical protein
VITRDAGSVTSSTACATKIDESPYTAPLCLAFWYFFDVDDPPTTESTGYIIVTINAIGANDTHISLKGTTQNNLMVSVFTI